MRAVKIILYFLTFQIMMFSEAIEMQKQVYYKYLPNINKKLQSGFEIQRMTGYCELHLIEEECTGLLYIADPKSLSLAEERTEHLAKMNIDMLNFKAVVYRGASFNNDRLYFNEKYDAEILDDQKEVIKKIKKMLMIYDTIKNIPIEKEKRPVVDDDPYSLGLQPIKKRFSTYITIRIPELSEPYFYVLDYINIDSDKVFRTEYTGRELNELHQYLKQFIAKNKDKNGKIPIEKYDKFMKKEIYETKFYPELNKQILILNNRLARYLDLSGDPYSLYF